MATYTSAFPIVYVTDMARSLWFYRDLLGFRATFQFPEQGDPEFVSLELAAGSGVGLAYAREGQTGSHGQRMHPGRTGSFELCVYTTDVDEAIAELRAADVEILVEPVDQPWNERMAYAADPDGYPLMICARIP
jgi:lactoylglutathione lyase